MGAAQPQRSARQPDRAQRVESRAGGPVFTSEQSARARLKSDGHIGNHNGTCWVWDM